jgi:hypothetical protein
MASLGWKGLRCKRQHVSALSNHHQANLIYINLVHKVCVHVMGSHDLHIHFTYLGYGNQIGLIMAR